MMGNREERIRREAAEWLARSRGPNHDPAALARWCGEDPRHRQAFDRLSATWEQAGLLARTEVGRTRRLARQQGWGRTRRMPLALAAALAALIVLAGALLLSARPGDTGTAPSLTAAREATGPGEVRTLGLPDGSRVTLSASSSLLVAIDAGQRSLVLEEGRARFFVAPDAARPFTVTARGRTVTAVGTVFDVVNRRDGEFGIAVLEGKVDVRGGRAGAPGRAWRLEAGQTLGLAADGSRITVQSEPQGARLEFDGMPVGEAVALANRHGGARIVLADPAIARLRLTGVYRPGDTEGLAGGLALAFGLRLEKTPSGDLVLHPEGR